MAKTLVIRTKRRFFTIDWSPEICFKSPALFPSFAFQNQINSCNYVKMGTSPGRWLFVNTPMYEYDVSLRTITSFFFLSRDNHDYSVKSCNLVFTRAQKQTYLQLMNLIRRINLFLSIDFFSKSEIENTRTLKYM